MKVKHILAGTTYCGGTERNEVHALCGYSEECSGSGRHTLDVGVVKCAKCHARRDMMNEDPGDLS